MTELKWTPAMTHCYNRNCNCDTCSYLDLFKYTRKCYIKRAIVDYIKAQGVPEELKTKGIIDS